MNFTVSGSELGKSTVENQSASINIKNNTQTKENGSVLGTSGFSGVLITGMQVNQKELDSNTYNALLKETDDVKAQIMQSATNAKANLKALFNRLSGADMVKIDEDGFNLNDLSQEEMVGIVDRIKIELAAHGKKVYFAGGGLSASEIEQVVGSAGLAEEIATKMNEGNLPATQENVEELSTALDKVSQIGNLSEDAKNYLVKNQLEPTIDNIYKAEHMQSCGENTAQGKKVTVTEEEWQQLMPQAANVIKRAGLEPDGKLLNTARNLLENDIPITKENILYKAQLDCLDISQMQSGEGREKLLENIVNGMTQGDSAGETSLIDGSVKFKEIADAMRILDESDIRHVAYVTERAEVFNIENLRNAMNSIDAASYHFQYQIGSEQSTLSWLADNEKTYEKPEVYSNYEQLQQIRILMTADAGLFLAKQGVNLHAEPISNLVEQLKIYHESAAMYGDAAAQEALEAAAEQTENAIGGAAGSYGLAGTDNTVNMIVSSFQTVMEVKRALYEIKHAPDVSMGAVVKEKGNDEALTIADFAQKGSEFRQRYEQAGLSYEAVGTEVRKDLGDSVSKAVEASYEDILKELDLESIQANKDAVRIFAENQMEITKENIENIKEIHATLQNIIRNMKPEIALNMIRENVNPMTDDIHKVNEYLMEMNDNTSTDKEEKYSRFLYKLEQTDGITEKEREQFIGIYKMMNIFTKDAGAAIGTLVKQNEEITMANLCKAYESRRAAGMDFVIDDESGIPAVQEKVNYFNNLFDATGDSITPLSLRTVQQERAIDEHSVEEFCEDVENAYDEEAEAVYYDAYLKELRGKTEVENRIVRELSANEQPVTVNQILAMESIMQSGYFNKIFDDSKAEEFMEKMDDRESLEEAYQELEENCATELSEAVASDENQNYESINELRMRYKEISLIRKLSARHDYKIPMVTEDGIGMIHLTLIQDSTEKGRISVNLNTKTLGTVSIEAKISGDTAELYGISDKDAQILSEKMQETAENLKERCGITQANVYCQDIKTVRRVTYDKAADSVAPDRLYRIAKTIVYSIAGHSH